MKKPNLSQTLNRFTHTLTLLLVRKPIVSLNRFSSNPLQPQSKLSPPRSFVGFRFLTIQSQSKLSPPQSTVQSQSKTPQIFVLFLTITLPPQSFVRFTQSKHSLIPDCSFLHLFLFPVIISLPVHHFFLFSYIFFLFI